jgi:hypothetical protein
MKSNLIKFNLKSYTKIYKSKNKKKNPNILREIKNIFYLKKSNSFLIIYLNLLKQNDLKLLKKNLVSFNLEFKSIKPKKVKLFLKNVSLQINTLSKNNVYFIKVKDNFCIFEQFDKFQNQTKKLPFYFFGLFDNGFFYYLNKDKFNINKKENYLTLSTNITSTSNDLAFNLEYLNNNLCLILEINIKNRSFLLL